MKRYIKSKLDRYFATFAKKADLDKLAKKADVDNLFAQMSALLEIKQIIGAGVSFGPLRGWAWSPDSLLVVLRELLSRSGTRLIEFGSGESTIVVAAALRAKGGGLLTTIEHDARFAEGVTRRLADASLLSYVDLRVVPLRDFEARLGLAASKSYDLTGLDIDFDIALIDGPIVSPFGAATRAIPVEWCLDRLKADRVIYADDAARAAEQAVVNAFREQYPDLMIEFLETEKGLFRLTRQPRNGDRTRQTLAHPKP